MDHGLLALAPCLFRDIATEAATFLETQQPQPEATRQAWLLVASSSQARPSCCP
jgi:hypothetical protein